MNTTAPKPALLIDCKTPGVRPYDRAGAIALFLIPVVFGALLPLIWLAFDRTPPDMDEAGHIMNSLSYSELFRKPHFWQASWQHQFLTVNFFYPPAVYIFNGALKLLLGTSRYVDMASLAMFNMLLTASVFGITIRLTGSRNAAFFSALFTSLYPGLGFVSHQFLLDFPLVAMVAAGLYSIINWQQKPGYLSAAVCGLAVGLAALSKQIGAAYLVAPLAVAFVELLRSTREKKFHLLQQAAIIAAVAALLFAPWLASNYSSMAGYARTASAEMGNPSFLPAVLDNMRFYGLGAIHTLSPLLFLVLALSVAFMGGRAHRQLLTVGASAAGGVLLTCTIICTAPLDRYLVPATIAAAIYSGVALAKVSARSSVALAGAIALLVVAFMQLLSFQFTPYPIAGPPVLNELSKNLAVSVRAYRSTTTSDHPAPAQDWGCDWVLRTIDRYDRGIPVWLNVMANMSELNAHSFELFVKERKSGVRPTTSRIWTLNGDDMTFSEEKALYYTWYLIKTGDCGNKFVDARAERENARWLEFVQRGGKFRLIEERPMPDGTMASLWRQI